MRTMKSLTILTPPSTGFNGLLSVRTQYSEGPEYEKKYQHYIAAYYRPFIASHFPKSEELKGALK